MLVRINKYENCFKQDIHLRDCNLGPLLFLRTAEDVLGQSKIRAKHQTEGNIQSEIENHLHFI